jgi:hypothetical protein
VRRTRVLTVLVVLLIGGAVGYWMWPLAAPTAGTSGAVAAGGGRGAQAGAGDAVTDIRLGLLERERGALGAPDRNPFRFERRASAALPARPQAARRPAPIDVPTGPLPPPPPPPIPLRFIGYLQPRDAVAGRVAVLSDGRGNVFNGREGDVIEGRYRLLRVGNDSADLIYLDGRGRQTIRLSGQ